MPGIVEKNEILPNSQTEDIKEKKSFTVGEHTIYYSQLKWAIFFTGFLISIIALIVIIIYVEIYVRSFKLRVDCNPDLPLNYNKCKERGCIWVQKINELEPPCFFPSGYGYRLNNEVKETDYGYHVELHREPKQKFFGDETENLNLVVIKETKNRLRLKFADADKKRYEVPLQVPNPPTESPKDIEYGVEFKNEPQFGVEVKRLSSGTVIFDTNVPGMIFSDQYLQITTKLPSANIYGLGEHLNYDYRHSTNWNKLSFFARDITPYTLSLNLYSSHPFYMVVEEDGNAHGVFLLNSNAMEVVIQPTPALTFRTIGGILDFYVFLGPTPEDVIQQYLQVIGLPMMPPYWSLGFHLSRFGYNYTEVVQKVHQEMISKEVPYDVQHLDIDYMEDYKDFTVDSKRFSGLRKFTDDLHDVYGMKLILILDPAIASNSTLRGKYPALDNGESHDIFIKLNKQPLEGIVWPGKTYYPDFSHPKINQYWSGLCKEFHKLVPYDGIWIDMNEPSNFVPGSQTGCEDNSLNYPPYACGILGSEKNNSIFEKTICMDAEQHAGRHYDIHNLYGTFEANATFRALSVIISNRRPFVLSRSTFPGAGSYAAHWLGDNFSAWSQLQASIPGILEFNLFGIPMVGADICGFNNNVTEELCIRWMQLGSFYPFCRNHNSFNTIAQDPTSMGDKLLRVSKASLKTRYELLPYLYTLFYLAHTKGSTVARPLLHEFPKDSNTWGIKHQFLWGPALMISPVVYEGATSVNAYFPEGKWYNFYTGETTKQGNGLTLTLQDYETINLHVRGGHILPLQMPNVTTTKSRLNGMGLFIAPDNSGRANGLLYWDDGETTDPNKYLLVEFHFLQDGQGKLTSNIVTNNYIDSQNPAKLEYVTICQQSMPKSIFVNNVSLPPQFYSYDDTKRTLRLTGLSAKMNEPINIVINN